MVFEALAAVTALVHLAFIVVLVGGAWVLVRRPALWKFHLPAVLAMTAVTLAGADCPLTALENLFRGRSGWGEYDTGFVSHYLVEPWHPAGITPSIRFAIIAIWIVPNVVAYWSVWRWHHGTPARGSGTA